VLALDEPLPDEVLKKLRSVPDIYSAEVARI